MLVGLLFLGWGIICLRTALRTMRTFRAHGQRKRSLSDSLACPFAILLFSEGKTLHLVSPEGASLSIGLQALVFQI